MCITYLFTLNIISPYYLITLLSPSALIPILIICLPALHKLFLTTPKLIIQVLSITYLLLTLPSVNSYPTQTLSGILLRVTFVEVWACLFLRLEPSPLNSQNGILKTYAIRSIDLGLSVKKYKSYPTVSNLDRIKVAEEKLHIGIQLAKANFEANLVRTFALCNDSKYIRNITKSAFIPATVYLDDSSSTLDTDKATIFNRYFYSIFSQNAYSLPAFDDIPSTNSILTLLALPRKRFSMR